MLLLSACTLTMTNPYENKEAFYNQLASVLSDIPRTDKLLLIGDFNAMMGRDNDKWPLVMGRRVQTCISNRYANIFILSNQSALTPQSSARTASRRMTTSPEEHPC